MLGPKILLLTFIFSPPTQAYDTHTIKNGFITQKGDEKIDLTVSVLDPTQANALFKKAKALPENAYEYLADGCYARATTIAKTAEKDGILMAKLMFNGIMRIKNSGSTIKDSTIRFAWHIVPVVAVRQSDGTNQMMIIDPAFADRPMAIEEYKKILLYDKELPVWPPGYKPTLYESMGDSPDIPKITEMYFTSRFQFTPYSSDKEPIRDRWAQEDLITTHTTLLKYYTRQENIVLEAKKTGTVNKKSKWNSHS